MPANGGASMPRGRPANRAQRRAGNRGQRTGNAPRARQTNPIYDPSQQLSGRSLKQGARALTDLETKPAISELARQIARTNRQGEAVQGQVGGFYDQFNEQAKQALAAQQGVSDRTNQTLAGIGQQTQDQIGAAGQQGQATLQPLADKGLDGGSFAKLAAEMAAQQGVAGQNAQTFRQFGATQGGNYEGLTAGTQAVGALRGTESLSQLGNAFASATEEPRAKMAELRGQRGALMVKNLGALRDSERNFGLAQQTLGLDAQKAAADAANDNRRLRQEARKFNIQEARLDRRFRLDEQKFGLDVAKDNYQRTHKLGPYRPAATTGGRKPLTPTQVNRAFGQIDQAKSLAKLLLASGASQQDVRSVFDQGFYTDENDKRISVPNIEGGGHGDFVNAAMDLAAAGYLSPANVKALHRYGLTIGKRLPYYKGKGSNPKRFRDALGL